MGRVFEYIDYQHAAVRSAFREWEGGKASTLLVLPTGCGKTATSAMVIQEALEHGRRALFLAERTTLIEQAAESLEEFGLDVSIEQAAHDAREIDAISGKSDVVVGSVQTLQGDRLLRWPKDRFGLIVCDEAHHFLSPSHQRVLKHFTNRWLLGLTATPVRGDGKNLGALFESTCFRLGLLDAIKQGWLVPYTRRKVMVSIDLKEIRTTGGDFNLGDLAERIGPKIEELCHAIHEQIGDRQTVIFTPDVGSAMCVAQVLRDAHKRKAKYVAGQGGKFGMVRSERNRVLKEFKEDKFQVIVSCDLLTEGWDCPQASCAVLLRCTKKWGRRMQMAGRVLRRAPWAKKKDCLILDFDWQSDDISICSDVDLFDDGSLDAGVIEIAKRKVAGGERDVVKAIDEAQDEFRSKPNLMIKVTGKKGKYKTLDHDPIGVSKILGIKLKSRYDMDKDGSNPATQKQLDYLRTLGVRYPEGLSRWGASKLISKTKPRHDKGLATISQVQSLIGAGVVEEVARTMTIDEASRALRDLTPAHQVPMFG